MTHKILIVGDPHIRIIDFSTIHGFRDNVISVMRRIRQLAIENGITEIDLLGDLFDKGYGTDVQAGLSDYQLICNLSETLNGELYSVIGNHVHLSLDSNPEISLIQPHPFLKPRSTSYQEKQIIRTPDVRRIGNLQISYGHVTRRHMTLEDFTFKRQLGVKHHIGLYHTLDIIPNERLRDWGVLPHKSINTIISRCIAEVDIAICGDAHPPIGTFFYDNTKYIVPGALSNTSDTSRKHSSIKIPIIIYDDVTDDFEITYIPFDLGIQNLVFTKTIPSVKREKLQRLSSKIKKDTMLNLDPEASIIELSLKLATGVQSFSEYISTLGLPGNAKDVLTTIIASPSNVDRALHAFKSTNDTGNNIPEDIE